jgi:hypothetical protein
LLKQAYENQIDFWPFLANNRDMKITLNKSRFAVEPDFFLRRAGYGQINSYHTGKTSYVRRFSRDHYPRFHVYYDETVDRIVFDLHLDQKQVSYEGADHAHNADHDGPVVEAEIDRLKSLLRQFAASGHTGREGVNPNGEDWEKQLAKELSDTPARLSSEGPFADNRGTFGNNDAQDARPAEEKKGFFSKLFGL